MKNQLLKLYQKRKIDFMNIVSAFPDNKLHGPFLISPSNEYKDQNMPLLIVGQETNGWTDDVDLESQMATYEDFNVGIYYRSSPFWNITRKVEVALGNKGYTSAWTNISKFDFENARPYGQNLEEISKVDDLLVDEIRILEPKVCIFFTGPDFDSRIKKIFESVEFIEIDGWPSRQLCQLKHENLPALTFRTYHPRYLRSKYLEENFIEFVSKLNQSTEINN